MNFIVKNFLRGLAIVVPIAVTIYVIYGIFIRIDRLLNLEYPGLGFVITLAAVVVIGILASNIVGRRVVAATDTLFTRAPFVKLVYSSIKDLIEAFVGDKRRLNQPVIVTVAPAIDGRMLGFVTREDLSTLSLAGDVAVYFPQSYNIAGNLLIVPRESVAPLDVDSTKLMAFIVSGGVSGF